MAHSSTRLEASKVWVSIGIYSINRASEWLWLQTQQTPQNGQDVHGFQVRTPICHIVPVSCAYPYRPLLKTPFSWFLIFFSPRQSAGGGHAKTVACQLRPEGRNRRGETRLRGPEVLGPPFRAPERLSGPRGRLFRGLGEVCSCSTEQEKKVGHSEAPKRSNFPGCPLKGFQPSGSYPQATDKHVASCVNLTGFLRNVATVSQRGRGGMAQRSHCIDSLLSGFQ